MQSLPIVCMGLFSLVAAQPPLPKYCWQCEVIATPKSRNKLSHLELDAGTAIKCWIQGCNEDITADRYYCSTCHHYAWYAATDCPNHKLLDPLYYKA
ncbi:hypothetical protein PGT21_024730 [Puccinia graminis f. sp. tritici]|uniref:Uncharacterized protein n=1 Tax=Puccinia graminis f. sp. tritici TaxID=56615 RepID=A0A5B0QX38_PUCGR|nr:hypothetical protein PGT21_024730 [Puccinia graminis f. sp. tritici]